jgi:hypothetical protein
MPPFSFPLQLLARALCAVQDGASEADALAPLDALRRALMPRHSPETTTLIPLFSRQMRAVVASRGSS